jgi:hypothetical protein
MESLMWSAIATFLLGVVVSILFAVVGWIAINFFGKPLLDFLNLKSEVHEEIIFTGNIDPMVAHTADYDKTVESLRRLGARVQAMNAHVSVSSLPFVFLPLRWFLSVQRYDLARAGRALIGLSNSLAETDGSRGVHRNSIQVALKLPPAD